MLGRHCLILISLVPLAAGCQRGPAANAIPKSAAGILEAAESLELFSLDPEASERGEAGTNTFHHWKVLGMTSIADAETRQRLVAALKEGVEQNKGIVVGCFIPRHGIRATRGSESAEFVICFECFTAEVYMGGKRRGIFLTTDWPQPVFDEVLRAAGVPLAKKPGH